MFRKIEIDFQIHQLIEANRAGFDEQPYIVLRRLLGLSEEKNTSKKLNSHGRPFVEDGIEIPHGSLARMEYMRGSQIYEGEFSNGMLTVNGKSFSSLSSAAIALAKKKDGTRVSALNGWKYWYVKLPKDENWKLLWNLREQSKSEYKI